MILDNVSSSGEFSLLIVTGGFQSAVISGLLQIASNALGTDARGPLAVAAFLFYPDFSKAINNQIFDAPK